MVIIRPGQAADVVMVRRIHEQAFGRSAEADLVDRLTERSKIALSLVAEQDGKIVGHILFSPVTIASWEQAYAAVGLAPVAVMPELQRQGIGSRLIQVGLEQSREAGYKWAVVLGHPAYYPRFGCVPASRYGLMCEFDVPAEAFMAIELQEGALKGCSGTVRYQLEFNEV